jgi:hypothetical protein
VTSGTVDDRNGNGVPDECETATRFVPSEYASIGAAIDAAAAGDVKFRRESSRASSTAARTVSMPPVAVGEDDAGGVAGVAGVAGAAGAVGAAGACAAEFAVGIASAVPSTKPIACHRIDGPLTARSP